jgi:hypothetical protein
MLLCLVNVLPQNRGWLHEFDRLPQVGERLKLCGICMGPEAAYNVTGIRQSGRFGFIVDVTAEQEQIGCRRAGGESLRSSPHYSANP